MNDGELFITVEEALEIMAAGEMIILMDDEDRENEGDLVMAAEKVTPESINFMITEARGLVCCAITEEKAEKLGLERLKHFGGGHHTTNFLSPVDAVKGTTTGISAYDRSETIRALADPEADSSVLSSPGHIFPLAAVCGGVRERPGHTEAVVELCELSGLGKTGVICEIINTDGTMSRKNDLVMFAKKHDLKILTIRDIIYHLQNKKKTILLNSIDLPTKYGHFVMKLYQSSTGPSDMMPFALTMGEIQSDEPILVRIHSECLTGDLLGSYRCDCGSQLTASLEMIQSEGRGVLIYLRQEGRGIGLFYKLSAYNLQQYYEMDTIEANTALGFDADERSYFDAAAILKELGVSQVRLLTNNPDKISQLQQFGIQIIEHIPLVVGRNEVNHRYFETKKIKMGHLYK